MEMIYFGIVAMMAIGVHGYPSGAPVGNYSHVCADMFPFGHDADPLNGIREAPFEIVVDSYCYKEGSTIEVTLRSSTMAENDYFEGLFIQAREYPDHLPPAFGSFYTDDVELKSLDCFDKPASALSQASKAHYYVKTFQWTAHAHTVDLVFVATVVHETEDFWMNLTSPMIHHDYSCGDVIPPVYGGAGISTISLPTMLSALFAGALALFA